MPEVDPHERAKQIESDVRSADAKRRADEEHQGEVLDKLLSKLDSVMDGVEHMSARVDALEKARDDKHRDDRHRDDKHKDDDTHDDHEPFAAQPTQGDDDPAEKNPDPTKQATRDCDMARRTVADTRADSARNREFQCYEVGARLAPIAEAWGLKNPAPLTSEHPDSYRCRILEKWKRYSPAWKDIELRRINDARVLDNAESQIRADAIARSNNPDVPEGQLFMISKQRGAIVENTFHGHPSAWMRQFMPVTRRYVAKINTKLNES
jgi:colicin import membrane protein